MSVHQISDYQSLTSAQHAALFGAIEQGLPLVSQPYLSIANDLGLTEEQVINTIEAWQEQGLIKRFGLVVRHRKLGYHANAMVVWDVPSEQVDEVAAQLSKESVVTLCYQRPRVLPHWTYNLFCMIHGKDRDQVLAQLEDICQRNNLSHLNKSPLFSTKAYKQRGASYTRHT